MSDLGCGFARAIRAAMLASVMLALALASHVMAGGHEPELWSIAPAGFVALSVALLVTRFRAGFGLTFVLLGTAQIGFHSLAEWCPPWCTTAVHHLTEHGSGVTMPAAHVAAAAISAAIFAYGDRVAWALGEWLSRRLLLLAPEPLVAEGFCAPFVFTRSVTAPAPGTDAAALRGPPVLFSFT